MGLTYDLHNINHVRGVDHPESIGIGPGGEAYTTGTGCQVYRLNLDDNTGEQFASTEARCLGSVVDADGNLYVAHTAGNVLKITPDGQQSVYATGPGGKPYMCTNYPAFDKAGNMYLSDSGDWSGELNGGLHKIAPGGGESQLWYPKPVDTPNAICLDADESHLYFVETFGSAISRVAINDDGSAGEFERIVNMHRAIPDGIAFDNENRLWIACHRPDAIFYFDMNDRKLHHFCEDWKGEELRGPTDISFAGPNRDIMLAASLDNLVVHRFDNTGVTGLKLNNPGIG